MSWTFVGAASDSSYSYWAAKVYVPATVQVIGSTDPAWADIGIASSISLPLTVEAFDNDTGRPPGFVGSDLAPGIYLFSTGDGLSKDLPVGVEFIGSRPYWELQPGSATPGDRVVPWTFLGNDGGGYDIHVCLVDIAGVVDFAEADWTVDAFISAVEPETAWTLDAVEGGSYTGGAAGHGLLPGRWLAISYCKTGKDTLPLPAGWTPVEGPKYLGLDGTDAYYAGKVRLAVETVPPPAASGRRWQLLPIDTPLTTAGIDNATGGIGYPDPAPAGDYLAYFDAPAGGPPPAGWPEGFTPLTSVTGPIAITDENAGGVIGDIAYVVSGYVYNRADIAKAQSTYIGVVDEQPVAVRAGEYFTASGTNGYMATADATFVHDEDGLHVDGNAGDLGPRVDVSSYWPYLERYDLKNKKWLPRIKLPELLAPAWDPATEYSTTDNVASYEGINYTNVNAPVGGGDPASPPPPDDPTNWVVAHTGKYYASEGGFAGVIGNKLYFGGGDGDDITGTEFFSYDPAAQTFERLDDVPTQGSGSPRVDYCPFGVAGGSLWTFSNLTTGTNPFGSGLQYTPGSGWADHTDAVALPTSTQGVSDQVQGVEIGGKLYFVYDRVYVFDPVALTVEAKAVNPGGNGTWPSWISGSKVGCDTYGGGTQYYDPATDAWTPSGALNSRGNEYSVSVSRAGVPYLLSSNHDESASIFGVYGLTGNLPTYAIPDTPTHLNHLGFSPRMAAVLQADPADIPFRDLLRAGFSPRQVRTLKRGVFTMKALLRGGFDRHQAKALVRS